MVAFDFPILILAAGASRRMRGADKLLTQVDGMPLLRRQAITARAATQGPVLITLPAAPHARYGALTDLGVEIVPVPDAAEGINASLRRGIAALPCRAAAAMILLADLPDLTREDLQQVMQAVDLASGDLVWRGATSDGAAGHPIILHADLFAPVADLRGDTGGKEVIGKMQDKVHLVPLQGNRARNDLDTPEDWARWHATRQKDSHPDRT